MFDHSNLIFRDTEEQRVAVVQAALFWTFQSPSSDKSNSVLRK